MSRRSPQARGPLPQPVQEPAPGDVLDPPAGVDYAGVLTGPWQSPVRPAVGILVGISLYVLMAQLVAQLVVGAGWWLAGRPETWSRWSANALKYHHLAGLVGSHLGIAMLIPITLLLGWLLHHRAPRWAASVQPGMRWRYLLLCLPIAAVVLNGIVLLGRIGTPWAPQPQPDLALWFAVVCLTAPLQAAGEEYFFRGYLTQAFGALADGWQRISGVRRRIEPRWAGVVFSALLFAFFHGVQNLALFTDRFAFGLLAGALVVWTGGLEAGIACHVVNNIFAFGWAGLFGGFAQARALQSIGWAQAASDVVGFALFAALAWWLSRLLNLATRTPGAGGRDLALARAVR